jgi:3-isopropylmalate/(R)-2-methylmalate dehydratase small subunit
MCGHCWLAGKSEGAMEKFVRITATACPLDRANIDTDQLLPARFLKVSRAAGFSRLLFHDLRFDAAGAERAGFPLNEARWRDARILVAARNFGGGSSREAAVYALCDYGIRCVIAPSFGDIFSQNAARNGVLAAVVAEEAASELREALRRVDAPVTVDLEDQSIAHAGRRYSFAVDPTHRIRLLNGWDDIDVTKSYRAEVATFRARDIKLRPWATLAK